MNFVFSDEQRLFQRTVREFLDKECPPERVRAAAPGEAGWSFERWRGLAELGVVGLTVPERHGGLGKDETDLVLLLEEAGRAALPEPLEQTTAVAVPLLRGMEPLDTARAELQAIADGSTIATYASAGTGGFHLTFIRPDGTRSGLAGAEARIGGAEDPGFDRAAFAASAVLCGIAARVIELAATYAGERRQFGKPIGSFQAVKHLLADALLGLDFARPAVYRAAWAMATDAESKGSDASMGKALASEAAMSACRSALQVHGAIGYTHEHDLHLWLTKGFALAHSYGTAAWHRERVARATLDQ
jgi:alkylation response protein AidB-like acyl-CoA dehydrogenase